MNKIRTWWIAVAGAVVVTAAAGLGAGVMAQTPVPGADTGTSMIDRVAEKLGISSETLGEAIETSVYDEIDERVAAGDLTQEQADAMKARIAELPDDALLGPGGPGGFGGHHGPGGHVFFGGEALAGFLGITEDELRTQMQADGATLATVAEAHGKSRDELKAFLTTEFTAKLADRVAAGDLTQEEADAKIAEKASNLDAMIDGERPAGFHGGRGFREFRPGDGAGSGVPSAEPTASATGASVS
jgi:polyhydroxyalkanoate synthesis regulator phasin